MLFTTTQALQGKEIVQYLGVVAGVAVLGVNAFRDMIAGVRDITGGRVASYEKEFMRARDAASEDMARHAASLGANGIIGIDLDYEVLGKDNGMIMVSASGTAVKYR